LARLFLACALASYLSGAPIAARPHGKRGLGSRIASLVERSPAVQRGEIGYKFVDLQSGKTIAERNPGKFYIPASNTKLYTTAMAMVRLGPNYKFQTELRTSGIWRPGQTAIPDLELVGGGDPNLSGRVLPYRPNSSTGDPLIAIEELADKIVGAGIHKIDGDVIGISTRYPGDLYPEGWAIDDSLYSYGAPVSALSIDDNTISTGLRPTTPGDLATLEMRPALSHFVILNQVITDASSTADVHISRVPGSNEVVLWGTLGQNTPPPDEHYVSDMPDGVWREDLAMDDPALFASEALCNALRDRGVLIRGVARSEYRALSDVQSGSPVADDTLLAVHQSPPLWEAIQVVNKVSQNLHAEMLFREVAHVMRGVGTIEAAREERNVFLGEVGITPEGSGLALADGSGLARQDLTTPDSTVTLLRYMWQRPDREIWLQSLPTGGVDGTLQHRFEGIPGSERIHAKTGSISHVHTLSGYIEQEPQKWLAFSVMVNATVGHNREVLQFIDRLCALFLQ
jgi:D-alanyl-D-alanine carboxypeptidase/D-alanyl-D-alanine-endopeptidase (penicillin-binding protein 4)